MSTCVDNVSSRIVSSYLKTSGGIIHCYSDNPLSLATNVAVAISFWYIFEIMLC
jgi:hypothetical protein